MRSSRGSRTRLPTAPSEHRGLVALASTPAVWHGLTVLAAGVLIFALQTGQWFFFDEWAFLEPGGVGLFDAHVGHWSTTPTLIYDGLIATFGLHSYLPFAALVTALHLIAGHLIWRICIATGVDAWIATAATMVFLFLGTGAENILWAFQIGFVGAVALGLWAFLLALKPTTGPARYLAILAISVFSLTWSGTAIPLVVATASLLLARWGWRRALVYVVVTAGVYLAWWLQFAVNAGPDTGGLSVWKLFVAMPAFLGVMLVLGFGDVFPIPGLGIVLLLAVGAWLISLWVRRRRIPKALPAVLLLAAAALFAFMTAYSRAALSVGSGRSSRYVYLIVLLMLPVLALAVTHLTKNRRGLRIGAIALLVLLAGYQTYILVRAAQNQSEVEIGSQRVLSAALDLYLDGEPGIDLARQPDPRWAPDITMEGLVELYEHGLITIVPVTDADLEQARANIIP